ncbi:hypothetical protein GCM10008983_17610 [Lentibacillus halophilus]|uniref:Uncharacterized protein n=1 Tax=Lentibacillus halophilus TaxID=295065 RepID=A0ABP3J4C9_9BACI
MPKVAEVTPMDIKFDDEKEREQFINWAHDKSTVDQPSMVEMRKKIKEAREIKSRMNKHWPETR